MSLKGADAFVNLQFCVDMFFALSGFVLCHAYGHRLNDGREGLRFAWMRLARLWPLHMVMLGLFVAIELGKLVFTRADGSLALDSQPFGPGHSPWELVTNILFLQSFNLHSGLSWNGPAWSAAVELYVSLLFAGVIVLFPRFRREIFLGLCIAAGWQLFERSPGTLFVSSDWGMLRAIFSFFAGCLAHDMRVHSNGKLETPNMLEVWALLLFAAFVLTTPQGLLQYAFPVLAVIVIYVFSFDQGRISALLRSRALQLLGLWSYSIYMGAHLRIPDREDGGLLYRPQNPSRSGGLAQQREAGAIGRAGAGGVVCACSVCRARGAGGRTDLSLDREAGAGCGKARGVGEGDCSRNHWRHGRKARAGDHRERRGMALPSGIEPLSPP